MKKIKFENGTLVSNAKVEIGGTIYDVTPEQYEGTTPLSASNMNAIQDNAEEAIKEVAANLEQLKTDVTNSNVYSTEEKIIGVWIDGKLIYRKTMKISSITGKTVAISLSELNIDEIFFDFSKSNYKWKDASRTLPIVSANVYGDNVTSNIVPQEQTNIFYNTSDKKLYCEFGLKRPVKEAVVTIEYTKTTD